MENKGFYNFDIKPLPEFAGIFGIGAKKNNDIETITIKNNSKLKSDDNVRQDAKIVIEYYNDAKYEEDKERNKIIAEYNEEQKRRKEELEQEQQIQREKEEKEKRLNSKKTLTLDEIDKVKLVTEYSDDAVIDEMDTIKFGKYPQDSRDEDDKQDIEWIVLDRKDGKALLLSKYILDCKKYDDSEKLKQLREKESKNYEEMQELVEVVSEKILELSEYIYESFDEDKFLGFLEQQNDDDCKRLLTLYKEYKAIEDQISITWADCTLRKWLNEEFINIAFSDSEKESIVESNIKNFDNFVYKTKAGEDTKDKIFCLSIDEAEKYFDANIDSYLENLKLVTKGTKYAKMVDNDGGNLYVDESGNSNYWLRSPGVTQTNALIVDLDGNLVSLGTDVQDVSRGIRPAMWVLY